MSAIKICGITRADDARAAVAQNADLLGLIFHRPSSRFVLPDDAARLTKAVPARWIGVFVDAPADEILRIAAAVGLHGVQLHGAEPAALVDRLRQAGLFVIKAYRIARAEDLASLADSNADANLLDAFDLVHPGGTGRTFDWHLATDVPRAQPILLAGGLHAGNVTEAIGTVRPWGVDVSSGVESSPGHKDPEKMARFVEAARAALATEGGGSGNR
jgi:phosphoribosylanthranilate isomerase